MQGVQRPDPRCRARPAPARGHHGLCRQELHLHHQDASGDCADQEGHQAGQGLLQPLKNKVGKITRAQLEEIANTKLKDMNAADVDAAVRTLAGSARSMGVIVEGV
ncbi:hypothetical protein ACHFCA_02500 [Delftia tsuruhatensis]